MLSRFGAKAASAQQRNKLRQIDEAGSARAIVAIGRAVTLLEPSLLGERHQHIDAAHERGKRQREPRVGAYGKADEPEDG
jgi:hypothetical protein